MRRFVSVVLLLASAWATPAFADDATKACLDAAAAGQTLRDAHKVLEAAEQFRTCASGACPDVVRRDCVAWVRDMEAARPTLVFDVTDGAGNDLTAVRVTLDGRVLAEKLDGTAQAFDPGEHVFVFEVAGRPPVRRTVLLKETEQGRRLSVVIDAAPPSAVPAPAPAPAPPAAAAASVTFTAPPPRRAQRTAGLVIGAVGVAALAGGAVAGLLAASAKTAYEQHCGASIGESPNLCDPTGVAGHDDASNKAAVSTWLFVGGLGATTLGAVLWFTAPRELGGVQAGLEPGQVLVRSSF
jgi:hypothetical protein